MKYIDAFLAYFAGCQPFEGLGLAALPATYDWPRSKTNKWPPLPDGIIIDTQLATNKFKQNIALKININKMLREDVKRRNEIANWIIYNWGGIRSNDTKTIKRFVAMLDVENSPTPLKGVASYSKLLAFYDLERYAIYDARVAVSLNAIQIIAGVTDGVAFPYVSGRNNITGHAGKKIGFSCLKKFSPAELCKIPSKWIKIENDAAYVVYIELLKNLKRQLTRNEIYTMEMALFSQAELLAVKADPTLHPKT